MFNHSEFLIGMILAYSCLNEIESACLMPFAHGEGWFERKIRDELRLLDRALVRAFQVEANREQEIDR